MFTKNKFQYCIYDHERLELHELQKEYQKDKVGTKLKYENQLFCPGCCKVDLVINEKKGKIYLSSHSCKISLCFNYEEKIRIL